MRKRESHSKSRTGCYTCKKRHVKCDEQGPPCANCVVRKTACLPSPTPTNPESDSCTQPVHELTRDVQHQISGPSHSAPSRRNLLELELMHRWCTNTYKSLCSVPEEHHLMQSVVPELALKHDFLMNGILAVTSLDIAVSSGKADSSEYVFAAIEFYDSAITSFRADLRNITHENHQAIFLFSVMAMVINIAIPQVSPGSGDTSTMLERLTQHFELLHGCISVTVLGWNWLVESGFPVDAALSYETTPLRALDDDTAEAIARLHQINDRIHAAEHEGTLDTVAETGSAHASHRAAISHLRDCFAEDARGLFRGYCIVWPALVDLRLASAVKDSEPMALLILMHWGILLERLGHEVWWATSTGKRLGEELSDTLQRSHQYSIPEWRESIAWVRERVGLPALLGIGDSHPN